MKRILFVDDEPAILDAVKRQFRRQYEIVTAVGPEAGLETIVNQGPFAVIVSDLKMPGMDGIEFLSRARQMAPDAIRVMLTGLADLTSTILAVNEGKIFQFLTKPCPPEMLSRTLDAALEQHRLITAERELRDRSIRGMSEVFGLINPPAFSRAHRIRYYVHHIAQEVGLPDSNQFEAAAILSQLQFITVPPDVLDRLYTGEPLNAAEQEIVSAQAWVSHELLLRIPQLEAIAQMIARQRAPWPSRRSTEPDPVATGAQLLRVATDFDDRVMKGAPPQWILSQMESRTEYNPGFVTALHKVPVVSGRDLCLECARDVFRLLPQMPEWLPPKPC